MTKFLMVLVLLGSPVLALASDQYREFSGFVRIDSGEAKRFILNVNLDLRVDRHGDPEIRDHGFNNYMVTGTVIEDSVRCPFEALLAQGSEEMGPRTTAQVFQSGADRTLSITLCSGLKMSMGSTRALLMDQTSKMDLYAPGLKQKIGQGTLSSGGIKTVPTPSMDDYRD